MLQSLWDIENSLSLSLLYICVSSPIVFGILTTELAFKQTFPVEVLELDKSVRTLDLSHNKIGIFFCFSNCLVRLSCAFEIMFGNINSRLLDETNCKVQTFIKLNKFCLIYVSQLFFWILFCFICIRIFMS